MTESAASAGTPSGVEERLLLGPQYTAFALDWSFRPANCRMSALSAPIEWCATNLSDECWRIAASVSFVVEDPWLMPRGLPVFLVL